MPLKVGVRPSAKVAYAIVHQNDARVRLRIDALISQGYAARLEAAVQMLNGVTEVRVNAAARSLAVEYQSVPLDVLRNRLIDCIQTAALDSDSSQADLSDGYLSVEVSHMVGYQVLHRTPYRLRLQIPKLADDPDYAARLKILAEGLEFVAAVHLNCIAKSVAVEYFAHTASPQVAQERLLKVVQLAAVIDLEQAMALSPPPPSPTPPESSQEVWQRLSLPALGLTLGLGALVGVPIPGLVTASVLLTAAIPLFQRAWAGITQEQRLTIDFLDGLALVLHSLQSSFFAPALMLNLIEGGEVIRDMTARGSERASLDLLDCLGSVALVERDGKEVSISVKALQAGDRVLVYPGDQIPVDGVILRGTGLVDQCKLTGESVPVTRRVGEEVFASTLLMEGHLCIEAEHTGTNTRAGIIATLMQSAPVHDTRVENYAGMIANNLVVPTLVAATGVGLLSGDLNRTISLLTLDLGTGIRISVPTTIMSALTHAARSGIFIRSGRALEMLARVDTVVFDKTGTLTRGRAGVTAIILTQPHITEAELLTLAATAEQGLTHPVAEAIIRHAKSLGLTIGDCEAWEYRVGLGIAATIGGRSLLVGSHQLMARESISLQSLERSNLEDGSHSAIYVAQDGHLLGVISYSDPLRPESKAVIQTLQRLGIEPYMLSGDVTRVAKSVAHDLGMRPDHVYADAFPEHKVAMVKTLHESGRVVAFCGDGINDSAALAYADVSISFAGATDIARETADIVLMEDDLQSLVQAIHIAREAMDIIQQNISIVAIPNVGAIMVGIIFAIDPVLAILINNGSAILAELNGLRPLLGSAAMKEQILPSSTDPTPQLWTAPEAEPSRVDAPETLPEPVLSLSSPLRQCDLAKRFGITTQTLSRRKLKPQFEAWSQAHDPEGQRWRYDGDAKQFVRVEMPVSAEQSPAPKAVGNLLPQGKTPAFRAVTDSDHSLVLTNGRLAAR